jgi:hypothetical protein
MGRYGLVAFLSLASCVPKMGNPASLITEERIIGVRADPAEAAPGDTVQYTSLVVSPSGTAEAQDMSWSLCNLRKPVAENTPVSQACLTGDLAQSAQGGSVSIRTPSAACVNFGPLAPPSSNETLRPTDPDATGGYYQPIRLDEGTQQAIFRERLRCDLAGASLLMAQEFRARYTTNQNPTLVSLSALVGETPASLDSLPAGQRIRLAAAWSPDSAEIYPVFDSASQTTADHREALWLSWFATAGAFDDSVTGRGEDDTAVSTENGWQSPPTAGSVFLWLVLHDSRGGADFASYTLTVAP